MRVPRGQDGRSAWSEREDAPAGMPGCGDRDRAKGETLGRQPVLYPAHAEVGGGGRAGESTARHQVPVMTLACYD
jgi:hypothetical protein